MNNLDKKQFNGLNILVLGDIILDHFIFGTSNRISPEAPVPIVEVKSEDYMLG
ncbi:MAG: D-glycero-beta-D-manno-heptose-7-phosphate kinase, partial [Candidatus Neomarinimicrobiota bacterium]|nr:D-glycero-beta-D-manno-heptose-7-phosphate kinase [Candidatus Neomarinimicrobiota bacterium]